jgi:hypothetical protein
MSAYKATPTYNSKEENVNNHCRESLDTYVRAVCFVPLCCYWIVNQSRTVTQPTLLIQIPNLFKFNVLITSSKTCSFGPRLRPHFAFGLRKKRRRYIVYSFRRYDCVPSGRHLISGEEVPPFLEAPSELWLASRNVSSNKNHT